MRRWAVFGLSLALCCGAAARAAEPGQIKRGLSMPPIPFAPAPVVVDGDPGEWTGETALKLAAVPVTEYSVGEKNHPGFTFPVENHVNVRLSLDDRFLYLALEWLDDTPAVNTVPADGDPETIHAGGDAFVLALDLKQPTRFAFWPVADGREAAARMRRGDGPWTAAEGLRAALSVAPDGGRWFLEAAIPWALATPDGVMPDLSFPLVFDLSWSGLDVEQLTSLSVNNRITSTHQSLALLMAKPDYLQGPHLPNPADWGALVFGGAPADTHGASSPWTNNLTALAVVPAAGLVIDGDDADWPADAFAPFDYLGGFLGRRYSGRLAVAADAEALYWHLKMSSATGVPDNFSPEATRQGYRGGDALQVRLAAPNGFKTSLCAWFDNAGGHGVLTSDNEGNPYKLLNRHGAEIVFKPNPGEGSWSMEVRAPWPLILEDGKAQPPVAGERWQGTFQPWWSRGGNAFTWVVPARPAARAPLTTTYEVPRDGLVSIGLYDADGQLRRQLLKAEFRTAGVQRVEWDGRDQYGDILPAGSYELRGVVFDPLKQTYEITMGNPGNPPWPTPDSRGDWLSDEATPQAAVTDGEVIFLAAPGAEKGYSTMAVDANGQRLWGQVEGYNPRTISLALAGDKLYALLSGPVRVADQLPHTNFGDGVLERSVIVAYDKRTGERIDFSKRNPKTELGERWPYPENVTPLWTLIKEGFTPQRYGGQPRYFCHDQGETVGARGLAATSSELIVSKIYTDRLEVYDALTLEKKDEIPLEQPVGLHALDDDTLLAVSGKQVVKVDLRTGAVTPVVTDGLDAPSDVTTDKDGAIYVSDWGQALQVKVFDADGKYLRAIGRPGGRGWLGPWDPEGMLVPRGLAVTDAGDLWVAEDDNTPKRISVWDAATGAFKRDFLGPTPYGGGTFFWMEPDDPNIFHFMGLRWEVDWENKTWTPIATELRRTDIGQIGMPTGHQGMGGGQIRVIRRGDQEFVVTYRPRSTMVVLRREGDVYVMAAAVGGTYGPTNGDGTQETCWDSDIGVHLYSNARPDFFRGRAGSNYAWSDLNGDGLAQEDEVTFYATGGRGAVFDPEKQVEFDGAWGAGSDAEGNQYWNGFCRGAEVIHKVPVLRWSEWGPVYDIRQAELLRVFDTGDTGITGTMVDHAGNVVVTQNTWSERSYADHVKNSLVVLNPDGTTKWQLARPARKGEKEVAATHFTTELRFPEIDVYAGWNWWWTWKPYLITSDGLFLAAPLEDVKVGPLASWSESFTYFFQKPDGAAYLVNGGNQGLHTIRLDGLETANRFSAPLALTADDIATAEALAAAPPPPPAPPQPMLGVWWADTPPAIDGDLSDWRLERGLVLDAGDGRKVEIALARDNDTFYYAARVEDPTPMDNRGNDWQTLFITGDVVDIMLATDPAADPHRRAAAVGDQRLLFSQYDGKPVAVRYRPKRAEGPADGRTTDLLAARFDEIVLLKNAGVAIVPGDGFYTVEAAIPLSEMGLDPSYTGMLRGDVGVVFGDGAGGRERRLYHYNKVTQMVADLTTEAELPVAAWGPFLMPLGPNQLPDGDFLKGFVDDESLGVKMLIEKDGLKAFIDEDLAAIGRRSLRIEQTTPVTFTAAASANPDYDAYCKSANDGRGGAHLLWATRFPVEGGKAYNARMFLRGSDWRGHERAPNHPRRGTSYGGLGVTWRDMDNRVVGRSPLIGVGTEENNHEWRLANNIDHHVIAEDLVGTPLKAPADAAYGVIESRFNVVSPDNLPKFWISHMEIAEVRE